MIRFKHRLKPVAEVNLIPMIDVVLQLVFFFMLTSTFIMNPAISVILPGSTTAEPVAMTKLVITIASREQILFNNQQYNPESLSAALAQLPPDEKKKVKTVILEGDRSISYELMIEVLDVLRKNGFSGVSLRTRQAEK